MNILFVNNFRGRGGGEEFLRDLLPGLVERGVGIGLVCRPGTPLSGMFDGTGVRVFTVPRSGLDGIRSVFTIAGIIREGNYHIVDIQRGHDIIQSLTAAFISRMRPILIYTPQVADFHRSRFLLGRMNRIVTISRHIRDRIAAFCPDVASKLSIVYYGIDTNRFGPGTGNREFLRKRFGIDPSAPFIGTVGDLWKNQIEFLDVLVKIREKFPNARYALVAAETGIGQITEFKDRARTLGVSDAVCWAGRLSKDEMRHFYASIDIAVSTHRNEGFGIWVLEALAAGKPVVAFNEGGIRDSLDGCPAGVLVNNGSEMAERIDRMLNDGNMIASMAAAGPRWIEQKFTVSRMIDDYYTLFHSLMNQRKTGV